MILFDCETNGFLHETDTLHCICLYDFNTHTYHNYSSIDNNLDEGLEHLSRAKTLIGHNIVSYDIPALEKLTSFRNTAKIYDTLILARMLFIHEHVTHSLADWGKRLKVLKGDFGKTVGFATCTPEMVDYCRQDVEVTLALWQKIVDAGLPSDAVIHIETVFAKELDTMMYNGVPFNIPEAQNLAVEFKAETEELLKDIKANVKEFVDYEVFVPKRNNKTKGYLEGVPVTRKIVTEFNPNSRQQVARLFKERYNWKPKIINEKSQTPKINADILGTLNYPEAKPLIRYYELSTLLGYLSVGDGSWLNKVNMKTGKIHGRIIHAGAVTHRCTHSGPNTGNIAKGGKTRKLFYAPEGHKFIGCDAEGLELRMLAHYLYPYDNGEYADTILTGDIHTKNQLAAGLETRDISKTFIYAFLYGGGALRIGEIVAPDSPEDIQRYHGTNAIQKFLMMTPAIKMLKEKVIYEAIGGWITALDGRKLHVHSDHVALNVLLQGGGAIVMKVATNICCARLRREKIPAKMVLHVHDEYNFIAPDAYAERVAEISADSIRLAGEYLKMDIPMAGKAKIGINWYEVH